ncbi:hypothetical protein BST95_02640 [Halioglobus japonicus]|uniref:Uncharacterized protein n=2 Tax=Halioglobus japonicus TaxID=930805 RepID=A0AAP8MBB4_9GAMM|nr:hypothetical protein [Halioglobus japonicus]AQA17284.1 hypothetical protein BST95_02640 [Halioglobus japonicus]PLW84487.1 hypothetical protein C0029_18975 [Halioglobus japonicus]
MFLAFFSLLLMGEAVLLPLIIGYFAFASGDTGVTLNGVETSIGEVRLEIVLSLFVGWLFVVAFAVGFWKGVPIARHGFVTIFVVLLVIIAVKSSSLNVIPGMALWTGLLYWYFYRKTNVSNYFSPK